ncbi:Uu.00g045440.m01.CDS01 [Anthostomella pinea]|uniref:Uu.00g045440.m01.CDS01 n=1 Tax=Anthostomella pinea TaxID=933095 RepID=A0AAI8YEB4_9PEZI|nr:Uu.00g045440.m01.CDS01 [Anthostomella pinea]
MVHLYVACRSLYPNDPVWPDMGHFLQFQDLDNLFLGGLPGSMEEAYKKLLLASGVTASSFARNRRNADPELNSEKARPVSNPCMLDAIFAFWMSGGEFMTDDMILNLVGVISDPKTVAQKARQAGLSPKDEAELSKPWFKPDRPMTAILGNLTFYIMTESSDLYFDWYSFAESCSKMWDQIRESLREHTDDENASSVPNIMIVHILDEARKCQWLAEELKQDVATSLRQHAFGLVRSWEVFQERSRKGMKVSFGKNELLKDTKAWFGDQQLFRVTSKALGESPYPHMSRALVGRVYKNWPEDDLQRSAVIRMNLYPALRGISGAS